MIVALGLLVGLVLSVGTVYLARRCVAPTRLTASTHGGIGRGNPTHCVTCGALFR
jgi:hypothetical protein